MHDMPGLLAVVAFVSQAAPCGICHEDVEDGVTSACGHTFCRVCVLEYAETAVRQVRLAVVAVGSWQLVVGSCPLAVGS